MTGRMMTKEEKNLGTDNALMTAIDRRRNGDGSFGGHTTRTTYIEPPTFMRLYLMFVSFHPIHLLKFDNCVY